jgi:hypothetical protein
MRWDWVSPVLPHEAVVACNFEDDRKIFALGPESFRESARLLDSLRNPNSVVNVLSVATVVGNVQITSISQRNDML